MAMLVYGPQLLNKRQYTYQPTTPVGAPTLQKAYFATHPWVRLFGLPPSKLFEHLTHL